MASHKGLTGADIHVVAAFSYANAAARTGATGFVAGDVGKMAWQTDTNTLWLLTVTTPTWVQVGAAVPFSSITSTPTTLAGYSISDAQPLDADLTALAGLTSAANKGIQFTGSGTAATYDLTAAGKALLDDAAASNQRTTLGLGTIATQDANSVSISGGSVSGITDLALADGGTGASLSDPNADRILFWDDSAGAMTWLTAGTGLTITTTTIDASGGGSALTVEEVDGSPTDAAVTKIVFPNGTLGIASHVATYTPAGGGGGATVNTGADASKGTGTSGDLYLPNDGFYAYRSTGSAQVPWGPIFPLTDPAISAPTSWIGQGSATVSTTNGGIHLSDPANASVAYRIRKKTAPSTPYTITACFIPKRMAVNFVSMGIGWRQSSDGKIVLVRYMDDATVNVLKATNETTDVANYVTVLFGQSDLLWMQITDNGTNRLVSVGHDGQNFIQIHTVGRTDHLTADEVLFFVSSRNATYPAGMTLLSWKET